MIHDELVVTLATVLVLCASLGFGCAMLVRRGLRCTHRWLQRAAATVTAIAVTVAAVQGWAHLMVDRSAVARAVAWMKADTGDLRRFPSRPISAEDRPLTLKACPAADEISDLRVETQGKQVSLVEVLDRSRTTAFLVVRDRCLLEERYGQGSDPGELQTSFSMAKSFLFTLVGIVIARGDLRGLDEPITTYLPELANRDVRYTQITLRHLLTMASGLHYEEHGLPWSDDALTYYSPTCAVRRYQPESRSRLVNGGTTTTTTRCSWDSFSNAPPA